MKRFLVLTLAAALPLSGCSLLHRSSAWDTVVRSRAEFFSDDEKGGYIEHLHRLLSDAGVEHKVVTYQYHFRNAYREDSVQTAVAIVYRDETKPRYPWWVMDAYHHVPTWLPNGPLAQQLGFFLRRDVEVLEEKEYVLERHARVDRRPVSPRSAIAKAGSRPSRAAFAGTAPRRKQAPKPADPLTATTLSGNASSAAESLFRSTHGTAFDPGSSVDRQKMAALRKTLLLRNRSAQLRPE